MKEYQPSQLDEALEFFEENGFVLVFGYKTQVEFFYKLFSERMGDSCEYNISYKNLKNLGYVYFILNYDVFNSASDPELLKMIDEYDEQEI